MIGIDTKPLIEDLLRITATHPIDRICPCFGCIVEGSGAVDMLVAETVKALESLAKQKRPGALEGFDWGKIDAVVNSR